MTEYELLKYLEKYDEDIKLYDFSVDELNKMAGCELENYERYKEKYFEFYDDVKCSSLKKQDW